MVDEVSLPRLVPVIMAGGIGARLWPLSRDDTPKQFLRPLDESSLLQQTVERLITGQNPLHIERIVVVTNAAFADKTREQLSHFESIKFEFLFEPAIRNTGPATAAAALYVKKTDPNAIIAMLAADHHIAKDGEFRRILQIAHRVAAHDDAVVTFGIQPNRPETGYGYIRYKSEQDEVAIVDAFVEKPDFEKAKSWLASGDYLWNSGMFIFPAQKVVDEFTTHHPEIQESVRLAMNEGKHTNNSVYLQSQHYVSCQSISIDYAIMEHVENMKVIPANIGWFDVGAWEQVAEIDAGENISNPLVTQFNSDATYVLPNNKNIVTVGTKNLVIVDTPDALLVCDRNQTQDVKKIYENFREHKPEMLITPFHSLKTIEKKEFNKNRIKAWLLDDALPFWLKNSNDLDNGGVIESFTRDGFPLIDEPRRVRVLLRQIYAFSYAKHSGWDGNADPYLELNLSFLLNKAQFDDDQNSTGYIHSLHANGDPLDINRMAYDQAFAILAFSWVYKITDDNAALVNIKKTLAFIDKYLNGMGDGGLLSKPAVQGDEANSREILDQEKIPTAKFANPHMHMLEACMAAYIATNDQTYLDRATSVVTLFKSNIFDNERNVLFELFDEHMNPVSLEDGQWIEPGHMFEWSHLLAQYSVLSGDDCSAYSSKLFAMAETYGKSETTGLVLDKLDTNWRALEPTSRFWPQLERLRAIISLKKTGNNSLDLKIEDAIHEIFEHFLSQTAAGLWEDKLDYDGNLLSDKVPQSTFYHIITAFSDYLAIDEEPTVILAVS